MAALSERRYRQLPKFNMSFSVPRTMDLSASWRSAPEFVEKVFELFFRDSVKFLHLMI